MLGLIAALTIPENKPCVHWMHEEILDVPFEEESCNSILLSIGGRYPNWTFLNDKKLELRGVLNTCQYKNKFIPDYIFYDGKIIYTKKSAPEKQSWIEWIQSIIETLSASDKLLIYEVYD